MKYWKCKNGCGIAKLGCLWKYQDGEYYYYDLDDFHQDKRWELSDTTTVSECLPKAKPIKESDVMLELI